VIPYLLTMVLSLADGSKQIADVAVTPSQEMCEALAETLNTHPNKPAEVTLMCRPAQTEKRT
jgi:hypothetical protein